MLPISPALTSPLLDSGAVDEFVEGSSSTVMDVEHLLPECQGLTPAASLDGMLILFRIFLSKF